MSDRRDRVRTYKRRAPAIELIPQAEMVRRIEAARVEEAPAGPTRWCYACTEDKPIAAFVKSRQKALGHDYICKPCKRIRSQNRRAAQKRRQFREILGRAS